MTGAVQADLDGEPDQGLWIVQHCGFGQVRPYQLLVQRPAEPGRRGELLQRGV
ncbi:MULTISPECIES: hypothetical protein [unclassified Micromonospora]|uniref:hypothetical protein n=1 Tax=unclassified Micromonospora TaxID=2617518 RepID=UPI003A85B0CB